jgi:hypothetical protein
MLYSCSISDGHDSREKINAMLLKKPGYFNSCILIRVLDWNGFTLSVKMYFGLI